MPMANNSCAEAKPRRRRPVVISVGDARASELSSPDLLNRGRSFLGNISEKPWKEFVVIELCRGGSMSKESNQPGRPFDITARVAH